MHILLYTFAFGFCIQKDGPSEKAEMSEITANYGMGCSPHGISSKVSHVRTAVRNVCVE